MNFMCKKHRDHLSEDPQSATIVWMRLITSAREQSEAMQWQKAIVSYGNAMDAAQIIFESDPASPEVNRYIRTACELAYTIRQCDYPCDIKLIVGVVRNRLEASLYPADVRLLLAPLNDIANSPLADVKRWIQALFNADTHAQYSIYH